MEGPKKYTKAWVPPESYVPIPANTRTQILPLKELPWDSFQRLCARLAQRCGDVERCQEYGLQGQNQEGIDIYVRRSESSRYLVWQCKRYQTVRPSLIEKAVSKFLAGSWVSKTDEFVLALTVSTEEANLVEVIEAQADRLRAHNIKFLPLGITQISERLKGHPDLVDDFFGRDWVREFCGKEAADQLSSRRLPPAQVVRLRQLLRRCYTEHFKITDPGLPSLTGSINPDHQPLSLVDRFVPPEILEEQQVPHTEMFNLSPGEPDNKPSLTNGTEDSSSSHMTRVTTRTLEVRRPAIDWLSDSKLSVVLGDPGIGKSTLLRCILLDLLSTEPRYETYALRWGQHLPVWVPFAMWTRLVGETETGCSLSNVLTAWLRKVSAEEDLVTLVQQALKDSRLLLFVDGLDEWSDETAARTALTLLEQFVGERNVPAIASSRPLGYERIGGLSSRWRKARLAGLTEEQQRILAERWFLHWSNAFATPDEDSDSIAMRQTRARAEAAEHVQDLHRDFRLSRLAEVPLLLNGLIALAIQSIGLPRSRFKAYEELTRVLLEEQPKRREKAAYARGITGSLGQENRERALARLAWETHDSSGSDALDRTVARNALQNFCQTHLYKTPGEALEIAEELLAIGAEAVGILVKKSSVDIGFLHRSFQEFLAAKHLSNLSLEQQKEAVKERFENPQWHDVFLCLCHLNTRAGEVDDFVAIVENMELPTEMELARQSFLAEIAFGDLHCSAIIARRLAEEIFEIIETGVHERTRERLVELALDGLESDALRSLVEVRIQRWYPLRHPYRRGFYETVATWSRNSETQSILWRGLLDEEESIQRTASESIATVFGGDPSVAERLFDLLFKPAEPRLCAYALHALCLGWGTVHRLTAILNRARLSTDSALQSVALIHRVNRNEHDVKDREILIDLSRKLRFASWYWREDRIRALISGWPCDLEMKDKAIRSVKKHYQSEEFFDQEDAGIILLEGFPQDDEVAEVIAHLFKTEDYPRHSLGLHSNWGRFVEMFAGHQDLGLVIDDWIERKMEQKQDNLFWNFELCLISSSARAKAYLLKANDETGVITRDQARWLLQGWGMQDEEAAAALTRFAESDAAKHAADLLPDILQDKELCRHRLLEIVRKEIEFRDGRALIGMTKLGVNEFDEEVVEAAVSKYSGQVPSGVAFLGISDLIEHFPNHPKVREVALYQLHNRGGDLDTVAKVYSSDEEIHCELLKLGSPLPAFLRSIVVDRLMRLGPEDDFAYSLLSRYDEDIDVNVKTAAAIGYVTSAKRRGEISSDLLKKLNEGLLVIGPDLHERRQAAFSALLELDQLDIVRNAWSGDEPEKIDFGGVLKTNIQLAALLTRRWDRISKAFGESFWDRVGWMPDEFLMEMAARTSDPDLLDEMIKQGDPTRSTAPLLQLYARQWRSTPRLRELCLTLVRSFHISNWIETSPGIIAAEVLAEQFANDAKTLDTLESLVNQEDISSALVIALSAGWPDSQAWKQLSVQVQVDMPRLLLPAELYLLAASSPPNKFVSEVGTRMAKLRGDIWEFLASCTRAVVARFARDDQVRELAFSRLETEPTSFEKMNFPSFLLGTDDQPERLRAWIRSEIKHQSEGGRLAEVALDLSTGTVRSVGHVLLEYLMA